MIGRALRSVRISYRHVLGPTGRPNIPANTILEPDILGNRNINFN